ncbi:MAG: nitrile hydratase accessory protein [Acidimicrobiales bacterium]
MSDAVGRLHELPFLPQDPDGPVFAEAWHAEAFATTMALLDAGWFSWSEWSNALNAAVTAAQQAGDPDLGDTYYHHWLVALEGLCRTKGAVETRQLDARQQQWRTAYERTPHGQPVELEAARPPNRAR